MAETSADAEKGLEDFEEEITCPICQEHFRDPKILPCCHYYCRECVQLLVDKAGPDKPIQCPECRRDHVLPKNDPSQLPAAFFVNRMKDAYTKMGKAHGKVDAMCEMCSGAKVEAFCRQCTDFICGDCVKSHQKLKVFAGHEVVTLEELKGGGTKHFPVREAPPIKCKEHEEQLKIFCFDCDCLICRDCIVIDHAGHKYEFVKKSAAQCREKLKESLVPLRKVELAISTVIKQVETTKTEVAGQGNSIVKTFDDSFKELFEVLKGRQQELMNKATDLVQQRLEVLKAQEKNLNIALAEVQNAVELVERNLENATDEEVMSIHQQILSRAEAEVKKHAELDLDVSEEANLTAKVLDTDVLTELCQTRADVDVLSVELEKCTAHGSGITTAEIGKTAIVHVHTVYTNGQPCGGKTIVEAELKSLVDGSSVKVKGTHKSKGIYEITYSPCVRGRHNLSVTVNSKPIPGSPFQLFVKIHPSRLTTRSRVFKGFKKPWGVMFTSTKQLLVTEWGSNKISVLDKRGKPIKAIASGLFYAPRGITEDEDGSMFVVDSTNALYKINKDGQLLKSTQSKHSILWEPSGVRLINDKLYVCDRANHKIAVFTKDLQAVRSFGSQGTKNGLFRLPECIIQDETGNMFITDYENHRVQVFDCNERFVRAFGSDRLDTPTGMCIDSNNLLYVCDFRKGCVVVFTPGGKYVTTISITTETNPSGVAIDEDGFVYICDFFNNSIVVM